MGETQQLLKWFSWGLECMSLRDTNTHQDRIMPFFFSERKSIMMFNQVSRKGLFCTVTSNTHFQIRATISFNCTNIPWHSQFMAYIGGLAQGFLAQSWGWPKMSWADTLEGVMNSLQLPGNLSQGDLKSTWNYVWPVELHLERPNRDCFRFSRNKISLFIVSESISRLQNEQ